ncbi:hypothetical protein AN958_08035 [Leucoagaricus sp. SymC.cos]|nr:hypothetical protein AN958_08035 [Leucoagaricus sp. SymC.cos]
MNAGKVAKEAQTPLKKFAYASTVTCSTQASAYGKCIAFNYMDIRRDICKEEFAKFAECMRTTVSR